jgi:hypothetical protein
MERPASAKAVAEGLSLEDWLRGIAERQAVGDLLLRTDADLVVSRMRNVLPEIMAARPKGGASQRHHYISGSPKKEE